MLHDSSDEDDGGVGYQGDGAMGLQLVSDIDTSIEKISVNFC